jgi:ubiquitin-like domain-containing CTD phosphatase 1
MQWLQHVANGENLKKFTETTEVFVMNAPREGKPLLVLDLDHTLLDFSSKTLQRDNATHQVGAGMASAMKRPHMDEFLTSAYKNYDLVVWSQTSWRVSWQWVDRSSCSLIGIFSHSHFFRFRLRLLVH